MADVVIAYCSQVGRVRGELGAEGLAAIDKAISMALNTLAKTRREFADVEN